MNFIFILGFMNLSKYNHIILTLVNTSWNACHMIILKVVVALRCFTIVHWKPSSRRFRIVSFRVSIYSITCRSQCLSSWMNSISGFGTWFVLGLISNDRYWPDNLCTLNELMKHLIEVKSMWLCRASTKKHRYTIIMLIDSILFVVYLPVCRIYYPQSSNMIQSITRKLKCSTSRTLITLKFISTLICLSSFIVTWFRIRLWEKESSSSSHDPKSQLNYRVHYTLWCMSHRRLTRKWFQAFIRDSQLINTLNLKRLGINSDSIS